MFNPSIRCKKNNRILSLALVLALALLGSVLGGAYAKYIKSVNQGTGIITSKAMYFESDYLTESGTSYNISTTSIDIKLMNYPDAFRHSELDVYYTVTVEPAATVVQHANPSDRKLASTAPSDITITIQDMTPGQTYTVTATGSNGYERVLTATFTVSDIQDDNVYMQVTDTQYYVLLTVSTQDVMGNASISFPTALIPDKTDPLMSGIATGTYSFTDTESFTVAAYSSRTYRFFKSVGDAKIYTASDFPTVAVNGTPAQIKAD